METKVKHFQIVEKGLSANQLSAIELNSLKGGIPGALVNCPTNFVSDCPSECPGATCSTNCSDCPSNCPNFGSPCIKNLYPPLS